MVRAPPKYRGNFSDLNRYKYHTHINKVCMLAHVFFAQKKYEKINRELRSCRMKDFIVIKSRLEENNLQILIRTCLDTVRQLPSPRRSYEEPSSAPTACLNR